MRERERKEGRGGDESQYEIKRKMGRKEKENKRERNERNENSKNGEKFEEKKEKCRSSDLPIF
jgi:hypothetical protein